MSGAPTTPASLAAFLADVGRFHEPDLEREEHRQAFGAVSLVLRRDCHGALRVLQAAFPAEDRAPLRDRLGPLVGAWQAVVPGAFDLADVPALGRVFLLTDRLDVTVRLEPARERLHALLERVTASCA